MKNSETRSGTSRREAMKLIAAGSTVGLLGLFGSPIPRAEKYETPSYSKGMAPVKIKSVNELPGLGVDINENEAAKYPINTKSNWQVRKSDGTIIRP